MALTESKKLKVAGGPTQLKAFTIGATETTFYESENVMVLANGLAVPQSSSSGAGNQFVGVSPYEQTVPASGKVTVLAGPIVVSSSGVTADDANKLVYAHDSDGPVTLTWTEGDLPIGRLLFIDSAEVNAVVNVGSVVSGSTI